VQRLLAPAHQRVAVGEQQAVELAVEQRPKGRAQAPLDSLRVLAEQPVGDEPQLSVADQPVREGERATPSSSTWSPVSSGQMAPTSSAVIPGASLSSNRNPWTSGPPSNSCRPAS